MVRKKAVSIFVIVVIAFFVVTKFIPAFAIKEDLHVIFSDFSNGDKTIDIDKYNLLTDKDDSSLMFVESRPAMVKLDSEDDYSDLDAEKIVDGEFYYLARDVKTGSQINADSLIMPVYYFEEISREKIDIPIYEKSSVLNIVCSDNSEKFPDDRAGLLIEFTSSDPKSIPYNMVLNLNGVVYDDSSLNYYFDNETGEFTNAYITFYGVTADEVNKEAFLEIASYLVEYSPVSYTIKQGND